MTTMIRMKAKAVIVTALTSAALAGCTSPGVPLNRSLESVHQAVVQRTNYTFDLSVGRDGVSPSEQRRLGGWFEAMDLRYGDRIAIDDPVASGATRASVEAVASRYGLTVGADTPATPGYVNAGTARVVITRSTATVPGCPDWGTRTDTNMHNATASGYGCAINGNLAAMVANPQDLVKGTKGSIETISANGTKAVDLHLSVPPTGGGGTALKAASSKGE